jgi:hypothetical protein
MNALGSGVMLAVNHRTIIADSIISGRSSGFSGLDRWMRKRANEANPARMAVELVSVLFENPTNEPNTGGATLGKIAKRTHFSEIMFRYLAAGCPDLTKRTHFSGRMYMW